MTHSAPSIPFKKIVLKPFLEKRNLMYQTSKRLTCLAKAAGVSIDAEAGIGRPVTNPAHRKVAFVVRHTVSPTCN